MKEKTLSINLNTRINKLLEEDEEKMRPQDYEDYEDTPEFDFGSGNNELDDILDSDKDEDLIFDDLTEKFMCSKSPCDTVLGEVLAAANKALYRWYNDGDQAGLEYGNETVNPPLGYLFAKGIIELEDTDIVRDCRTVEELIETLSYQNKERYETFLNELKAAVVGWARENKNEVLEANDEIFLDYDPGTMYTCSECGESTWEETDLVCPDHDDYAFDVSDYLDNPDAEDYTEEAWEDHGYEGEYFCKHCWDTYRREVAADAERKWEDYLEYEAEADEDEDEE